MTTTTTRKPRVWFTRTVRDGRVTIEGVTYRPDAVYMAYDGRLDGIRLVFARYLTAGKVEPFIGLWGTERHARHGDDSPGPECVDGGFPWLFWHSEEPS